MAGATTNQDKPDTDRAEAAATEEDVFAQITSLAHANWSVHGFFTKAFRAIAGAYGSPFALLHARFAAEELRDDYHSGPTDPAFWKASLRKFLLNALSDRGPRAKLLNAKRRDLSVAFLAAPLFDSAGGRIGAIALVAPGVNTQNVHERLAALSALARLVSHSAEFVGREGNRTPDAGSAGSNQSLARAARVSTMEELAFGITNSLRNKVGGEHVALGMVSRNRVRIVSISGLDDVRRQSPGTLSVQGAMEECLDRGESIVCQTEGAWSADRLGTGHRLHKQWHAAAKGAAVTSIPLRAADRIVAILSIRRKPERPFTREEIEAIRKQVEAYAPALLLTRKAHRSVARHAFESMHEAASMLTETGHAKAKVAAAAAALFAAWFLFGTLEYQITVPCTVTPAQVRHVAAPFGGVLASARVIAGDVVRPQEVLCEFDRRDLELERAELLAEIAVLEREQDRGMAASEPAEVQVAAANQRLARAKLMIVERRIEQATVRAPIAGIVVNGDLRKQIGGVLEMGDPLFEVAPLENWTLELAVPESAVGDVSIGLLGAFACQARPEEAQEFQVQRIRPRAELRDERNVFVAEARMPKPSDWMRPGMEGVAKVRAGPRRVWWVSLHRIIDYLRLNMWI